MAEVDGVGDNLQKENAHQHDAGLHMVIADPSAGVACAHHVKGKERGEEAKADHAAC